MLIRPSPQRPTIFPLRFLDRQIVDARKTQPHQPVLLKLPVLIPIRPKPVPRIVVRFISKTHRDAIPFKRPKLLDQPVVQLLRPFAFQKRDDFLPPVHKFRAVSPSRFHRIRQRHLFRIARIPRILRQPHLLNRRLPSKRRQRRPRRLPARLRLRRSPTRTLLAHHTLPPFAAPPSRSHSRRPSNSPQRAAVCKVFRRGAACCARHQCLATTPSLAGFALRTAGSS